MRPFAAVDLETSGLDENYHEIIEVGIVYEVLGPDLDDPQVVRTDTSSFSLPFDEDRLDPKAAEVNGWGKREFAPLIDDRVGAANLIANLLADCHLVGKNPQFDDKFLRHFLKTFKVEPTWHHRLVDVGALVWGWHSAGAGMLTHDIWPQPPNVAQAAQLVDVEWKKEIQHTALGDAQWAYDVFRKVVPLP